MPRHRAKVDGNHAEVVSALRAIGAGVLSLAPLGRDVPDLVVSFKGRTLMLEVKHGRGKLTDGQAKWIAAWPGEAFTVWTVEEALQVVLKGRPS